ncbi:metallothionein-1B-like [Penaeus indicus]|uniref:metallothionein-1B-like n=1 Tax=Penaeus indicus TaxID=29960 RepID=UPI00300DA811
MPDPCCNKKCVCAEGGCMKSCKCTSCKCSSGCACPSKEECATRCTKPCSCCP